MRTFKVNVKTQAGRYLQAANGGGSALNAGGPWPREWETFWLHLIDSDVPDFASIPHSATVTIGTVERDSFVVSAGSSVQCGPLTQAPPANLWKVETTGVAGAAARRVRFASTRGLLAAAADGSRLATGSPPDRTWMQDFWLELAPEPRLIVSLSAGGRYLQAVDGGGSSVNARGPWAKTWESFEAILEKPDHLLADAVPVRLRTESGHYLGFDATTGVVSALEHDPCRPDIVWHLHRRDGFGQALRIGGEVWVTAPDGVRKWSVGPDGSVKAGPGTPTFFTVDMRVTHRAPSQLQARQASVTLIRDALRIDDDFLARIDRLHPGAGTAVLVVATRITQAPGYRLRLADNDWWIASEDYVGNDGTIDVSALSSQAKARDGAPGAQGVGGPFVGAPGKNGQPGETGALGRPARSADVVCTRITNLDVHANGACGGRGGDGGAGGDGGTPGQQAFYTNYNYYHAGPYYGSSGGNGGAGGDGGNGGAAGHVGFHFATGALFGSTQGGGPGGAGGVGGRAGRPTGDKEFIGNWEAYPDSYPGSAIRTPVAGVKGPDGRRGLPGADTPPGYLRLHPADLPARIRSMFGEDVACAWGDHRAAVASYRLRRWNPGADPAELRAILEEARRAQALAPQCAVAEAVERRILQGLNALDVPVLIEPSGDFAEYDAFVTGHAPMVDSVFDAIRDILIHASDVGQCRERLEQEQARVTALRSVLATESSALDLRQQEVKLNLSWMEARLDAILTEADKWGREATLAGRNKDGSEILLGFAKDVVTTTVGLFREGKPTVWEALAAYGAFAYRAGMKIYDLEKAKTAYREEQKKLAIEAGGFVEMLNGSAAIIDEAKALAQVRMLTPSVNDAQSKRHLAVLEEVVLTGFELLRTRMVLEQVRLQSTAQKMRQNQAEADQATLLENSTHLSGNLAMYADVVAALLRVGHECADVVLRQCYMAGRAAEFYTLNQSTDQVPADTGYVHPDVLADALEGLRRGDARGTDALMGQLALSWAGLASVASLASQYHAYQDGLSSGIKVIDLPDVLADLREQGVAAFRLGPEHFANRYEAKVEHVQVQLCGPAQETVFECLLQHRGVGLIIRRDGSQLEQYGETRQAVVTGFVGTNRPDVGGLKQAFWGRSPLAHWRLKIEPEELSSHDLDLQDVTGLRLHVRYRAQGPSTFLRPRGISRPLETGIGESREPLAVRSR